MTVAVTPSVSPRRTLTVCGGAHALHDGFTDLLNVLYPLLQAQFGLSYAAIGALQDRLFRRHGGRADPVGQACRALRRREGSGDRHGIDRCRLRPRGPHRVRSTAWSSGSCWQDWAAARSIRSAPAWCQPPTPACARAPRSAPTISPAMSARCCCRHCFAVDRRFAGLAAGTDRHRRDRRAWAPASSSGTLKPVPLHDKGDEAEDSDGRTGSTVGLLAFVLHPHCRRPGAHRLHDLFALPAARQRRRHADHRSRLVAVVRRWRGGQAGDGLGRREARRRAVGDPDRGGDDRADSPACCRCRCRSRWCCCRPSA